MAGARYYTPNPFENDSTGNPIVGAQLFFYQTGSSSPQNTYADVGLTVANANPVVADSTGHFGNIWLGSSAGYRVVCYGPNPTPEVPSTPASPQGSQLWTADPVGPAAGGAQTVVGIIGEVRDFAGIVGQIPTGWYQCFGQPVSRSTYAAAFAALGTTWGAGDGSTTFNLPDLRGRASFGVDNMGGTAANRVTSAVCSIGGSTLGAVGGDQHSQADTLTFTASSTLSLTDPGHTHTFTHGQLGSGGDGNPPWANDSFGGVGTVTTATGTTGISGSVTTSVLGTSSLTGASQNMPPAAMVLKIIYLGA